MPENDLTIRPVPNPERPDSARQLRTYRTQGRQPLHLNTVSPEHIEGSDYNLRRQISNVFVPNRPNSKHRLQLDAGRWRSLPWEVSPGGTYVKESSLDATGKLLLATTPIEEMLDLEFSKQQLMDWRQLDEDTLNLIRSMVERIKDCTLTIESALQTQMAEQRRQKFQKQLHKEVSTLVEFGLSPKIADVLIDVMYSALDYAEKITKQKINHRSLKKYESWPLENPQILQELKASEKAVYSTVLKMFNLIHSNKLFLARWSQLSESNRQRKKADFDAALESRQSWSTRLKAQLFMTVADELEIPEAQQDAIKSYISPQVDTLMSQFLPTMNNWQDVSPPTLKTAEELINFSLQYLALVKTYYRAG